MTTPALRTIIAGLLAVFSTALTGAVAAQGLMDCTPPLRPAAVTDARVLAEYAPELREEYALFFDEAQDFFRCLERARIVVTEEVNQAIADYGALDPAPPN
jgi:hypothetical protein